MTKIECRLSGLKFLLKKNIKCIHLSQKAKEQSTELKRMGIMAKAKNRVLSMQNAWCKELLRTRLTIRQVTQSVSKDNLECFKQIIKKAMGG